MIITVANFTHPIVGMHLYCDNERSKLKLLRPNTGTLTNS